MSNSSSSSSGIGFAGVLTVALVVLKLLGYISISWWWVFAPIWVSFVLVIGFLVVVFWAATR